MPNAPLGSTVAKVKKSVEFESKKRSFRIGGDIQPKSDLTRFVKWPQYVRLQRQKRILMQRCRVPPAVAQFQHTLDKAQFEQLARLCKKIAPETKAQKKERLRKKAADIAAGASVETKCPPTLKFGINHVTDLVENKQAKLVVIAHDVDPVELVCWLPALCRKKDVPYCIVKSKSRLGKLVHQKTSCVAAITSVKKEDQKELETLAESFKASFNDNKEVSRHWGGGIMGNKSNHVARARQAMVEKEMAKKTGMM